MQLQQEQLSRLERAIGHKYEKDLAALYRSQFPQLIARLDQAALEVRVGSALLHCEALGVKTANGRVAYVGLALVAGPHFDTNEKVNRFIALQGGDPDANVEWLFRRVCAKLGQPLPQERDISA